MTKRDARALHQGARDLRTASPRDLLVRRSGRHFPALTQRGSSCPALCRASTSSLAVTQKTWMAGTSPAMTEKALRPVSDFQKLLLTAHPNHYYIPRHPVPLRGAFRERHGRGAGCGGRSGALDGRCLRRTAKTCGPDTPTLVSSRWRQLRWRRWQESRSPGRARYKP